MAPASLKVPGRSLGEWLSDINNERRTGKLQIILSEGDRELYFLAGDLYLAPDHPAYGAAKAWLKESRPHSIENDDVLDGFEPVPEDRVSPPFRQLTGPIIELSGGGVKNLECSFVSGAGQIRLDLVGPLPTKQLIMECAVWGADEATLWRRLGGDKAILRSSSGLDEAMIELQLEPQEAFLLSRLDPPARVGELVNQLDVDKAHVLSSLCRLQAVGLVERLQTEAPGSEATEPKGRLISKFEESIGDSLKNKPLEIDQEQHRELLGNLLSRMGEMTYFEMLAVAPQASEEEVHQAYFELGRLVHPVHTKTLGLTGKEGAFRVLFERATDAYLTLNDPIRRTDYLNKIGPSTQALSEGPSGQKRDLEKQEIARQHYERALSLAERQDFHSAIQLLEQAVKVDPRIEYLTLLGDCQAENPQWLDRAVFSYQWALQVRPGDPYLYSRLGRVHERRGATDDARRAYEAALVAAPEMEDAKAGLWRLGGGRPQAVNKPSLVDRLRRILGT